MKRVLVKIALWVVLIPFAYFAQASPVLTVGESASVRLGDALTVPVRITDATDLKAFQFDLSFDPLVLEAVGISDAGTDFEVVALAGGGALTGLTGFMFPGLLSGVADSMSGVSDGLYGDGVLTVIAFRAIGLGVSALTLSNAFLDFAAMDAGALVNGFAAVPEPGALWLSMLGLGCLVWCRNRTALGAANRPAPRACCGLPPFKLNHQWRAPC